MGRLMPAAGEDVRPRGYRGHHRNPGPLHRAIDAALGVVATVGLALAMPTIDPGPGGACQQGRRPVSAEEGTGDV